MKTKLKALLDFLKHFIGRCGKIISKETSTIELDTIRDAIQQEESRKDEMEIKSRKLSLDQQMENAEPKKKPRNKNDSIANAKGKKAEIEKER